VDDIDVNTIAFAKLRKCFQKIPIAALTDAPIETSAPKLRAFIDVAKKTLKSIELAMSEFGPELTSPDVRSAIGIDADIGFCPFMTQSGHSFETRLLQCHAFLGQFLFCFLVFGQVLQPHATQYIGRLGELNIVVTDDLYSVAPGVPKIKERPLK